MAKMESPLISIQEEDMIKLILEFLSTRHYHVAMRTLEKESGVVNCNYSDEILFLRELVMDGDFNEIMQFGNSFAGNQEFDQRRFNFIVLRQKYIELIYTKSHIIGKQTYNIIEDVMKTLSELKSYCSSKEEYSDFCWLLTVPNLNSLDQFKNWSIDLSRLKAFEELLDCLSSFMPLVKKKISSKHTSANDRLVHIIVKGLFYESCIEYCQSIGRGDSVGFSSDFFPKDLLKGRFDDYSSNLLSWIISLPHEAFTTPFQRMDIDFRLTRLGRKNDIMHSVDVPSGLKNKSQLLGLNQGDTSPKKRKELPNQLNSDQTYDIINSKNETVEYLFTGDFQTHKDGDRNEHVENAMAADEEKVSQNIVNTSRSIQKEQEVELRLEPHKATREVGKEISVDSNILTSNGVEKLHLQREKAKLGDSGQQNVQNDSSSTDLCSPTQPHLSYFIPISSQDGDTKPLSLTSTVPTSSDIKVEKSSITASLKKSLEEHKSTANYHRKKSDLLPVTTFSGGGKDAPKEVKRSSTSPRKTKSHPSEENNGMATSTPKSNQVDKVSFPPLSPVAARKLELGSSKVVHDEKSSLHGKDSSDILAVALKQDLPIGYSDVNGKENVLSQPGVNLGPVINGVRRPISKMMSQPAPPQINEQPPEIAPTQPVLKGAGPKIKLKDGSKVHLKELMKSKECNEVSNDTKSSDLKITEEEKMMRYVPASMLEDTQAVRTVSFHPDGNIYAIGANSKVLRICDMVISGDSNDNASLPPMTVLFKRTKYHRGSIYCMDWSPDGRLLATGSNDKSIKILQFDPLQYTQTGEDIDLNFHNGTVRELAFVPNKTALLISGGTGDGIINITDTVTQKIVGTLNGHTGNVMSVFAGVDLIATGGTDNAVRLWDLRSRRCIDVVIVGESCPASVTLSDCDKYLASGQEDGSILVYDLNAGRTLENFRLHQSDCRSVRFSNDSNLLLTSSYDGNITLTHLSKKIDSSPMYYNVAQHSDKVIQCRWHPTENIFLSSSADRTSVLWKHVP